ncbi:MAG: McrB family protein [Vibrio sp.]|uniref:McrB family protein n=1 Tax=Vibrio sp. TaxID=678 RepID=UPI003A87198B
MEQIDNNINYWLVGASYSGGDDQTERFLKDGVWQNGYDDRYLEQVKQVKVGDKIAIKSAYVRTRNESLPFDNRGHAVSTMKIKAVGTVTKNHGDGQWLDVDWQPIEQEKEWYFYTSRNTIWQLDKHHWRSTNLIGFAFYNQEQDIIKFRNSSSLAARFGDQAVIDAMQFPWTGFYEQVATALLKFKNDRQSLLKGIFDIAEQTGLANYFSDQYANGEKGLLQDICPFTVMGMFNRGIRDSSRTLLAQKLADFLSVDAKAPTQFNAIPTLNNINAWFFLYERDRQSGDIDKLWEMFEAAINFADQDDEDSCKEFVHCFEQASMVANTKWNLTMGLFWIRPWSFPPLDTNSRNVLQANYGYSFKRSNTLCSAQEYLNCIDFLNKKFATDPKVNSFPAFSYSGWASEPVSGVKETERPVYEVETMSNAKNIIYYGPPGTGKTYHTIEAAVKAAAPEFQWNKRDDLKEKYDLLVSEKRIRFVTFHQSYGYEEFVEGISAKTDNGQVSYYEKDGIFKEICQDATVKETDDLEHFELALKSLMQEADGENIELTTSRGNSFTFTYHGNSTFRIFPHESKHEDLGRGYPASIKHIRSLYTTGDESDIYNRSYVRAILNYLKEKYNVKDYDETKATTKAKNYVLIIDEINRGNISKIFGELITLIEPSKRAGSSEKIEVTLPYTGHKFSVPDNLYIIGTMNTADRSLALMDTALRRRFEFIEMMPDSRLFEGQYKIDAGVDKSIDLSSLLKTLNARIEALYDREHTLGHAFFFPAYNAVKEGNHALALQELQSAFKRKVIPLLQEYFYDDWSKIRLVLGDNQKLDKQGSDVDELQFIHKKSFEYDKLFGSSDESDHFASDEYRYELADDEHGVWGNGLAYIAIYDPTVAKDYKKQPNEAQVQNEGA